MGGVAVFDTLAYAKKLRAAGVPEKQAEAQAEAEAEVISQVITDRMATKDDVTLLRKDMENMRVEIKGDIKAIKWIGVTIVTMNIGLIVMMMEMLARH